MELKRLFASLGTTAIYVTHDQAEAMTMSDRIAVFSKGRLQQIGTPLEIYRAPANRFVASFVGSPPMTVLPGVVQGDAVVFAGVAVPLGGALPAGQSGREVLVGMRAEDVALRPDGFVGSIGVVEHLGSAVVLHMDVGEATILAQAPEDPSLRAGDQVRLRIDPDKLYLFDRRSEEAILTPGAKMTMRGTP